MTAMASAAPGLDATTRAELAASLRLLFAEHTDAAGLASPRLAMALSELGWQDVMATDPAAATSLLFAEHGRALASSRALDDVILAELAGLLPAPTGPRAVLYPVASHSQPSSGLLLGSLDGISEVVAPDGQPGTARLLVLPAATLAGVTAPAASFDAASGWLMLVADLPLATPKAAAGTVVSPANDAWDRAEAAGRRALAAEIAGVCEAALALATAHTTARVQYGRSIASFQAVRHRLAEAHVAVAAIWATLDAAWVAAEDQAATNRAAWAARIAKMQAGRAQAAVLRHTVQVLGAMGLTRESAMHRYVTRAAALDWLLGDHLALAQATGADLLAGADLLPVAEI
jgi:Acyl-CoA dehydrogenase, C-terminal domain